MSKMENNKMNQNRFGIFHRNTIFQHNKINGEATKKLREGDDRSSELYCIVSRYFWIIIIHSFIIIEWTKSIATRYGGKFLIDCTNLKMVERKYTSSNAHGYHQNQNKD